MDYSLCVGVTTNRPIKLVISWRSGISSRGDKYTQRKRLAMFYYVLNCIREISDCKPGQGAVLGLTSGVLLGFMHFDIVAARNVGC